MPMDIELRRVATPKAKPTDPLGFGLHFADHMFRMDYEAGPGWHRPRIEPYGPIPLDPAASVLHYAQMAFEGMKALRGSDDRIRIFRPQEHASRFRRSCSRLCIPPIDVSVFVEAIRELVALEHAWVPSGEGKALYIRPFVIATEPFLGVRPSNRYAFFIILSPVGSYYARGGQPVRIWVERQATRAAPGGTGAAKTGGNYASSLQATLRARESGYDQVLWTDAHAHKFIEEVGTMNLFVRINDVVYTPPLNGTVLGGVTRDSVIQMLRDDGIVVKEVALSLDELREAHANGTLKEIFGTGTAAVVTPVAELGFQEDDLTVGDGAPGDVATLVSKRLNDLQRGRIPDVRGWTSVVVPRDG
ncbi:MAG: branched-chain amino acid aminotransferase [Myxococcales bacterium]|nr:branched-chain amino acid aminotransferase [Myxococcales bacterium]